MKYYRLCLIAVIGFAVSCAPKTIPSKSPEVASVPPVVVEEKAVVVDPKLSAESIAGNKTFDAKCGRCHGLKKVDDFTAQEWIPIVDRMAPKSRLDSTEKANVLKYVQTHAKGA